VTAPVSKIGDKTGISEKNAQFHGVAQGTRDFDAVICRQLNGSKMSRSVAMPSALASISQVDKEITASTSQATRTGTLVSFSILELKELSCALNLPAKRSLSQLLFNI
jgi:hypothetical protein